jgi:hypothetical protein
MEALMTISNWLMVTAVLLAPVIAIQVSEYLQRNRASRHRKQWVFSTLMATRAASISPDHVRALNSIDLEFTGKGEKERAVIEAWKAYLAHLNNGELLRKAPDTWGEKRADLFADMMHKMAQQLDQDFQKTRIRETSYWPEGLGQAEDEWNQIRRRLADLLSGKVNLPVTLLPPDAAKGEEMERLIKAYLKGEVSLKVVLNPSSEGSS